MSGQLLILITEGANNGCVRRNGQCKDFSMNFGLLNYCNQIGSPSGLLSNDHANNSTSASRG